LISASADIQQTPARQDNQGVILHIYRTRHNYRVQVR
jgi:hypothetical protein